MKKMGPIENLIKLLPGMGAALPKDFQIDPKMMSRKEAVVQSMTMAERKNPELINASRRRRIAAGCGQTVHEINQFLSEFDQMRKTIRQAMSPKGVPGMNIPGMSRGTGGHKLPQNMSRGPKVPKGGKSRKRFGNLFGR